MMQRIAHLLILLGAALSCAGTTFAAPIIVLQATEPEWTIAGSAQSFMNFSWDVAAPPSTNTPANQMPPLTQRQEFKYKIWQAPPNLRIKVQVTDNSMQGAQGALNVGDQLIIQFDGDNNGAITAENGVPLCDPPVAPATTCTPYKGLGSGDKQYVVTLNKNSTIANVTEFLKQRRGPRAWSSGTAKQYLTRPANNSWPNNNWPGAYYDLDLTIPLADIDYSDTGVFGIAMGWVNDTGYTYNTTGSTDSYFSGAAFPADLTMTDQSNPGLVNENPRGLWTNPDLWAKAYLTTPLSNASPDVRFSHQPSYYFSESIRLGNCTALSFDVIDAAQGGQQGSLRNWYLYNAGQPCKMGVWARANNLGAAGKVRFLVLWADGGLGQNAWRTVALTPEVSLAPGQATFVEYWTPPPGTSSSPTGNTHPCVKVYAIRQGDWPAAGWTEQRLRNMTTGTEVAAFEQAFGKQPSANNDFTTAQMNFTNLATGNCSGTCAIAASRSDMKLAFAGELRGLGGAAELLAQATHGGAIESGTYGDKKGDHVDVRKTVNAQIIVRGFGVPVARGPAPYTFIEEIGGLGWSIPVAMIQSGEVANLGFVVGNPRVSARDFSDKPPRDLLSPVRNVYLTSSVTAPSGVSVPKVAIDLPKSMSLEPGQDMPVRAKLAIGGTELPPCKCQCGDFKCKIECKEQASNSYNPMAVGLALFGTLGIGGFSFLRRRRSDDGANTSDRKTWH